MAMVLAAIVSLFLGIVCNGWIFSPQVVALFAQLSPYVLYLLMFAVGISVGTNKLVFQKVGNTTQRYCAHPAFGDHRLHP